MNLNDARALLLDELARLDPRVRNEYPDEEVFRAVVIRLPDDAREFVRSSNNLARASLLASVEKAQEARREWIRSGSRTNRRRRGARR